MRERVSGLTEEDKEVQREIWYLKKVYWNQLIDNVKLAKPGRLDGKPATGKRCDDDTGST